MADPNTDTPKTAKAKKRKVRLPVTLTLGVGEDRRDVPPGTEVELDDAEAARLVARFGEVKLPLSADGEDGA